MNDEKFRVKIYNIKQIEPPYLTEWHCSCVGIILSAVAHCSEIIYTIIIYIYNI